jgi:hypothetical protein
VVLVLVSPSFSGVLGLLYLEAAAPRATDCFCDVVVTSLMSRCRC